ncbi:MAG: hypothetical protein WCB09_09760, partial [Methylocella sp.]
CTKPRRALRAMARACAADRREGRSSLAIARMRRACLASPASAGRAAAPAQRSHLGRWIAACALPLAAKR